ncbi:hypothetical protein [Pseudomonas sp. HY7a-MNA-CIBAN-0227]|uniref:hypothetical protein n=1 Tax=Pseudomonas sp. HY7a-MNA-CIBAN-0227 TaxID=3140474 RepID=UPI00331FDDD2
MKGNQHTDIDLFKKLYIEEKKTPSQIAQILSISKQRTYQILDQYKIEKRQGESTRIKNELRNVVYSLYVTSGLSKEKIAKRLNKPETAILKILKELGLVHVIRTNPRVEIDKETLVRLFIRENLTAAKIAEMYGISLSCVFGKLSKGNIKKGGNVKLQIKQEVLQRMYIDERMTAGEIASHYNVARTLIYGKLNKFNIKRKDSKAISNEEIINLIKSGMSQREISKRFNVSQATISIMLKKDNHNKKVA